MRTPHSAHRVAQILIKSFYQITRPTPAVAASSGSSLFQSQSLLLLLLLWVFSFGPSRLAAFLPVVKSLR